MTPENDQVALEAQQSNRCSSSELVFPIFMTSVQKITAIVAYMFCCSYLNEKVYTETTHCIKALATNEITV